MYVVLLTHDFVFIFLRLEVILLKAEVGLMWQELVKGDKQGEELMDHALIDEIHARLAHLTSETEVTVAFFIILINF